MRRAARIVVAGVAVFVIVQGARGLLDAVRAELRSMAA